MKTGTLVTGAALLLAIGGTLLWTTRHAAAPESTPTADHVAAPESAAPAKVLYWYDPMKPEVHFDKPGKSPFMDMQLKPKYASSGSSNQAAQATITVSSQMTQSLGIRTEMAMRGTFWQRVDTVGNVEINPHLIRVIESRATGWIEQQAIHTVGAQVHQGQAVAGVYAPDLYAAQQELVLATRSGDAALADAARQRLLLLGADPAQLSQIQRSGKAQRSLNLVSPIDGVVLDISAHEGKQIGPGMPLMRVADLSQVWIIAQVPESQSAWVTAGRPAEARLAAMPGEVFEGRVDYVYPSVDAATRTLSMRLVFDNPQQRLKPGMFADVALFGGARRDVMMIPSEALIRTGTRNTVIVADDEQHFRPVSVEAGPERNGMTVILSGLDEGQRVVVSGQFLIDSEANLRGAFRRINGATPAPDSDPMVQP
ncbi:efflux RND transporter periplasmic adaptor subunit [Sinimarinibacterium sp. CAU 1509]|uniref:efflux RND transporter periplasmic adaptor subunit n=1 Tax=Sinimarinibacterium sp. CAU 1509 TaxID=2562283 RepID=UPI00146CD2D7|nr:efflux RND transporter periplasmic adaptor subunit [Sinimarinibacterium sp. CAU 1509]